MARSILSLTVAAFFVRLTAAQQAGWIDKEVNTTMCYWANPRGTLILTFEFSVFLLNPTDQEIAGVIRDTLYIDGGYLWWNPGLSDGSYAGPTADGIQILQWPSDHG